MIIPENKIREQAEMFANRLDKRFRHLRKWAARTGVSCYRLYDRDIPEVPLAVDLFREHKTENLYLHFALYERPYEKNEDEEESWLEEMKNTAGKILNIPDRNIFSKTRKRQRGTENQYGRSEGKDYTIIIEEYGSLFRINLSGYLDTGIFLDHRPARLQVKNKSKGKNVLNLFCYTGAFSIHAAAGGARCVDSVDISKTYVAWTCENFRLNGFHPESAAFPDFKKNRKTVPAYNSIQMDAKEFITEINSSFPDKKWDIIICDPPTFSNSKRTKNILDINRDWEKLCLNCLVLLAPGGTLLFSTNSRSLKFDGDAIRKQVQEPLAISDLSDKSIPEDFRNRKIHRLWAIQKKDADIFWS
ncbi:class I SAM-dependent methyltransferase [Brucepastera parasyntrophica]|uniref:class I SAM-dependent methyltransferase n=1 Tax=Brucepastera parasyntrophica TaxID=2880008 RepID=UPI00210B27C2|nr:class I SAM-dependent methyltransferase [Brucepastera parasyntrophica]ULQ59860.1 class I SAM-dependent methyltransferase [Brucepastera parasyntrophica]